VLLHAALRASVAQQLAGVALALRLPAPLVTPTPKQTH
jgi:hypothetical protein